MIHMPTGNEYLDGIDIILRDNETATRRLMSECIKCHNLTEEASKTTPKQHKAVDRRGGLAFLGPTCNACKEAGLFNFDGGIFTENREILFSMEDKPETVIVDGRKEIRYPDWRRSRRGSRPPSGGR